MRLGNGSCIFDMKRPFLHLQPSYRARNEWMAVNRGQTSGDNAGRGGSPRVVSVLEGAIVDGHYAAM